MKKYILATVINLFTLNASAIIIKYVANKIARNGKILNKDTFQTIKDAMIQFSGSSIKLSSCIGEDEYPYIHESLLNQGAQATEPNDAIQALRLFLEDGVKATIKIVQGKGRDLARLINYDFVDLYIKTTDGTKTIGIKFCTDAD